MKELLNKDNVIGFGKGKKVIKGKKTNKNCITVLVTKKVSPAVLTPQHIIPETINGKITDVIEVGIIKALSIVARTDDEFTSRRRPAIGGISIGHKDITAGTFGCVVYRNEEPYILSNNHVLANSNQGKIGDSILQPGPYDGGNSDDVIGALADFVQIKFDETIPSCGIALTFHKYLNKLTKLFKPKYTWSLVKKEDVVNYVDAAIAKPITDDLIRDEILKIGRIKNIKEATLGMKVQKSGRTTGHTQGVIEVMNSTVKVNYGRYNALFEDQIIAGPISKGGDSGSVVLDLHNNLVGLLFAGSDQVTIINPIQKVFDLLNVRR